MSPTAVVVALLVIVPASAYAETKAAQGVSAQALKAKTEYCKTCHGVDAQGFRGAAPMPRLAGQQPEYIKNQLQAFIERRRTNPVMNNVAHVLSPEMVTALSEYFKSLNPKPDRLRSSMVVAHGRPLVRKWLLRDKSHGRTASVANGV
jgi:cytochrome c553